MFSTRANDKTNWATNQARSSGPVSKADTDKVSGRAVRRISGHILGITLQLVEDIHELTDFLLATVVGLVPSRMRSAGCDTRRGGIGRMVQDSHKAVETLQEAVLYKLYAHAGLAKLFVTQISPAMAKQFKQVAGGQDTMAVS